MPSAQGGSATHEWSCAHFSARGALSDKLRRPRSTDLHSVLGSASACVCACVRMYACVFAGGGGGSAN
jgi:hypothetical protein